MATFVRVSAGPPEVGSSAVPREERSTVLGGSPPVLTAAEREFVRTLFAEQGNRLYRYLKRLLFSADDAQEAVQETFLRVLRQPRLERIREMPKAYLFQTATNLARDWVRNRARVSEITERHRPDLESLPSPAWDDAPDLALEGEQTSARLEYALERMRPQMRAALLLKRFDDLSHKEIARRLDISERTVERHIKDGLALIAQCVEGSFESR